MWQSQAWKLERQGSHKVPMSRLSSDSGHEANDKNFLYDCGSNSGVFVQYLYNIVLLNFCYMKCAPKHVYEQIFI